MSNVHYDYHRVPRDGLFNESDRLLLDRFERFHWANPNVFNEIIEYILQLQQMNIQRCSIWLILNKIRWDRFVATRGAATFKINNDFFALYARLVVHYFPQYTSFFEFRSMKEERQISQEELNRRYNINGAQLW